jgi:phosphoglycerate dehydrogenase-like enzyme
MIGANLAKKEKVLLDAHFRRINEIFDPADLERLNAMADVIWGRDEPMPAEEYERIKADLFAIITPGWRHGPVSEMPRLRAIMDVGGGLPSPDSLDYRACFARSIRVLTCAPAFGPMVAEMALGMVLAATREIVDGHMAFVAGEEKYLWDGNVGTFTLFDQTVGFIGFGGLARALKPLLDPFGCRMLAYDPWLPDRHVERQGVVPVGLDELLENSMVIFVLAIPSRENEAMLNRELLGKIKQGSVLALMSRAHVVDFDALTDMVNARRFKAVIDVFPEEPLPQDHPIRQAPGVVLSAHRAGAVERDLRDIGRMVVDDLETILAGLPPTEMQVAQPEIIHRLR